MGDRTWIKDSKCFIAGTNAGIAMVLTGQPFDIIKVRQATSTVQMRTIPMIINIFKTEGPMTFYKGTLPPLIGFTPRVSVKFGV
jgi:solute carrier family 25 carnitine/acylcarnitine transporter 20/29